MPVSPGLVSSTRPPGSSSTPALPLKVSVTGNEQRPSTVNGPKSIGSGIAPGWEAPAAAGSSRTVATAQARARTRSAWLLLHEGGLGFRRGYRGRAAVVTG